MEKSFWIKNWEDNKLGFHNSEYNELLLKHFDKFNLKPNSKVFVPLCGKSIDLIWLAQKGHQITGVEVSPLAVQGLLTENKLDFKQTVDGKFKRFNCQNPAINILEGDFFDVDNEVLGQVNFIYDRASMVALPEDLRKKYSKVITRILSPGAQILLVAIEYDFPELIGPPFAIFEKEVRSLYEENFSIEILEEIVRDVDHQRFMEKGLKTWGRKVYKLVRI